jgi:hypothetical protein
VLRNFDLKYAGRMSNESDKYIPFSRRTGLEPIAPQLKLNEVSGELRRLIYYYTSLEIDRESYAPYTSAIFRDGWKRVAQDLHVIFFRESADTFKHGTYENEQRIKTCVERTDIGKLFNFVEFMVRYPKCSDELKRELTRALVDARAAYRVFDNTHIVAIGADEQAESFLCAVADAEAKNATGARLHLIGSGIALRNGDWADSVRESINAVESVAVRLAPGASTLGAALKLIEKQGHLHGRLKVAFEQLYAYTNAEGGVRHANVFDGAEAQVDEADALFMLAACASFVSYLLARGAPAP